MEATLTLIGGPTIIVEIAGLHLLTDPTFDAPGEYQARGVILRKNRGPAIPVEKVGEVDAVLLSHEQHFDNLDRAGRAFALGVPKIFTTPASASTLGPPAVGLAPWETVPFETGDGRKLFITSTPARHGPAGFEPYAGDVTGFLLGVDRPGDAICVTGDTVWFDGIAEIAEKFQPRLIIANAGSAKPGGPFRVTMDNNDVIETAHVFPGAKIVVIYNDGWAHFTESQADAARAFDAVKLGARLHLLEAGRLSKIVL